MTVGAGGVMSGREPLVVIDDVVRHPVEFRTVHPRTALWWQQRETCRSCKHLSRRVGNSAWVCSLAHGRVPGGLLCCIDARDPAGVCGPGASLFKRSDRTP